MRYFNTSYVVVQRISTKIPRIQIDNFNTSYVVVQRVIKPDGVIKPEFQYILCCGSTYIKKITINHHHNISIHLMLWFNEIYGAKIRIY